MTRAARLAAVTGSALWLTASLAAAQDPTAKASAVQLFDEADKLMLAGNISAACPKYHAVAPLAL